MADIDAAAVEVEIADRNARRDLGIYQEEGELARVVPSKGWQRVLA